MKYPVLCFILLVLLHDCVGNNTEESIGNKGHNDLIQTFDLTKSNTENASDPYQQNTSGTDNQQNVKENLSLPPFNPFGNLMFKPLFHFKRITKINNNVEPILRNKDDAQRLMTYDQIPDILDLADKKSPAYHKSIIITKLRDPFHDRPKHLPFYPHFDPMLGVLDRMMDNLMQMDNFVPVVHIKPKHQLQKSRGEDSSLKFWIDNENVLKNDDSNTLSRKKVENPESDSEEGTKSTIEGTAENNASAENVPDYKTDLWNKFLKKDGELKPDSSEDEYGFRAVKRDTCRFPIDDTNSPCECVNESKDEKEINNYLKENDNEWWNRLVLPWKRKIYRQQKKDVHAAQDTSNTLMGDDANTLNKQLVGLNGKGEIPAEVKKPNKGRRIKHSPSDTIIGLSILGIVVLLVYKISGLIHQEYNALAAVSKKHDNSTWRFRVPAPGSPPPRYCPTIPPPNHVITIPHVNRN